ncbi:MAG: hypothetical protein R3F11_27775 [Verrucomicrobiales bacterium]
MEAIRQNLMKKNAPIKTELYDLENDPGEKIHVPASGSGQGAGGKDGRLARAVRPL